jgi:rhodanese-related sulfurtransferase
MEQKNSFIQKTFVDLNISENRLKVLDKAKPQFRQAIKRELERSRQVSSLDFFMIIGLGLALGVIFNLVNPNGINPIPAYWFQKTPDQIDPGRAKLRFESGEALLVDARPESLYRQRHIKGAVNLPLSVFDFVYLMKFSHLDPERELIVYGRNISRQYDQEVALQLTARGHTQVKILSGGLQVWQERGFSVEP